MNDLMAHVERIVRPVRASQRRKLRMRRELLAHLEAAAEEERQRGPGDDRAALARAVSRLGAPAELTNSLQATVPWPERLLLGRVPAPRAFDRWEVRTARRLWNAHRPLTLLHAFVHLVATFVFGYAAMLAVVTTFRPADYLARTLADARAAILFNLACTAIVLTMFLAAGRYAIAVADTTDAGDALQRRRPARRAGAYALCAIGSLLVLIFACAAWVAGRAATPAEITRATIAGAVLIVLLTAVGHWLGRRSRPYLPWLAIDLAA